MHDVSIALLGVTGLLALAALLVPLAARANLALSVVLAAVGTGLGLLAHVGPGLGIDGPAARGLEALGHLTLPSEAVIEIFLPVLLFETALGIDVRHLRHDFAPIVLLAVVAVLVSTFVVGVALDQVASVGLVACLLLAAIVSTTDPVAVVAIFRDLGVPGRLSLLVEGESLFNDAAAIALFALFLGMLTGERAADAWEGTTTFLRAFAGGMAAGALAGYAVCGAFRLLRGQRFAKITLTLAAAYLVYLTGEHLLHVSGVVAVVSAALVVGSLGRTQVSAESWDGLVDVWRQVGYWASALIFLLATLRVPEMLAGVSWRDATLLAVLVVSALAARALVLFGLFPGLAALGWARPISAPLRAVVVWGGLRGAISLALALAVVENPLVAPEVKSFVGGLATAFVLVTMFVNAPLLRPLIRLFRLDRLSPADLAVRGRAIAQALAAVRARLASAAADYAIAPSVAEELAETYTERLGIAEIRMTAPTLVPGIDEVRSALALLAAREQATYFAHYRAGVVGGRITRALMTLADRLQDGVKAEGAAGYEAAWRDSLAFPAGFRVALAAHRHFGFDGPIADEIADRTEILLMTQAAIRDLLDFSWAHLPALMSADAATRATAQLAQRMDAVETALAALRLQWGDYSRALERRTLARAAARIERAEYHRLRAEAVISHEVFCDLMGDLAAREARLAARPPLDLDLDPATLVGRVPAFSGLPAERLAAIGRLLAPRLAVPGQTLLRKGDPGDGMYFIASGAVEVRLALDPVRLGSGEFFGELALVTNARRNADVVALGFCSLLMLRRADFEPLLAAHPDLRARITETARRRLAAPGLA